jgi:hypothetical protein
MPVFGEDLAKEVGRRFGAPVQMMQLRHGIFDEASISVIASDTVREIGRLAGRSLDARRFRPDVLVRLLRPAPFQEDEWLGGVLSFGEGDDAPAITVTMRDERCSMVNLDPDSASPAPEVMKAVVRAHQNTAGIYGAVTRTGRLSVGQTIFLRAATEKAIADGVRRGSLLVHCVGGMSRSPIMLAAWMHCCGYAEIHKALHEIAEMRDIDPSPVLLKSVEERLSK